MTQFLYLDKRSGEYKILLDKAEYRDSQQYIGEINELIQRLNNLEETNEKLLFQFQQMNASK